MSRNVLVYGKFFTTAHIFTHVLRRLFECNGGRLAAYHFHYLLDDQRDADYAAVVLPHDRVTIHIQYRAFDLKSRSGVSNTSKINSGWLGAGPLSSRIDSSA